MDENIVWHRHGVDKHKRQQGNGHKSCIIWFTGFSGSGKSTIAGALENTLHELGHKTYLLDGDNVRHGLCGDLGFTDADRKENIRRVGETAKLMVDAGLIVLTAFISPFQAERDMVRSLVEDGEFIEVYLDTPIATCEQRDPKGLYKKARAGEIAHFTGIDSDYEIPLHPELSVNTAELSIEECVAKLLNHLKTNHIIG
ncbi:adenylyl-sulfate kinase [Pseudoalteromonas sp. SSDWG2]|uniref:adenylyl-sulfate kinase n=1 Tax=Pseudoalteromonas sp. SSDWG2 TaxID=3139391 RepID=UPI003BAD433D